MTTARVSFGTKVAYGFGSIAFGVKDQGFRYILLIFYNQVIGLDPRLVAIAIMCALAVDSLLDPIVGQVSDNWRSKWGRRHPFMYAAALPAVQEHFDLPIALHPLGEADPARGLARAEHRSHQRKNSGRLDEHPRRPVR